jgi:3-hydroxyisobutyrate dehydrogenase
MNDTAKRIGFIGLGKMGFVMAGRLQRGGHSLIVLDALPAIAERFVAEYPGATPARGLEALSAADVVITMLPNSDIVEDVILGKPEQRGLIGILHPGSIIIEMSSSEPMRSKTLAQALEKLRLQFLDAPVSGGVQRAVDGSLAIMVGGEKTQFDAHQGLFKQMGKTITHVGPAGAGHALKALNNYVSAAGLVAAAEALLVGQEFGLDPALMTEVFNNSSGRNYATENKVKQFMLSDNFNSGFSLQLMAKDLAIAMNLGKSIGWRMLLGEEVLRLCGIQPGRLGRPHRDGSLPAAGREKPIGVSARPALRSTAPWPSGRQSLGIPKIRGDLPGITPPVLHHPATVTIGQVRRLFQ